MVVDHPTWFKCRHIVGKVESNFVCRSADVTTGATLKVWSGVTTSIFPAMTWQERPFAAMTIKSNLTCQGHSWLEDISSFRSQPTSFLNLGRSDRERRVESMLWVLARIKFN